MRPRLSQAFKAVLTMTPHWRNIGILLGLSVDTLEEIQRDEATARDCMRVMLSEWLKQIDPQRTWTRLIDVVEIFDRDRARSMRMECDCKCYLGLTIDSGCLAHLSYKCTFFHKCILSSCMGLTLAVKCMRL